MENQNEVISVQQNTAEASSEQVRGEETTEEGTIENLLTVWGFEDLIEPFQGIILFNILLKILS